MTQYDYVNWLDEIIDYYESNDVDIDRSFLIRIIERMADSANVSFDEMVDILDKSEASEEFREEDHPRDSDGKFTNKNGGDSGSDDEPKDDHDSIMSRMNDTINKLKDSEDERKKQRANRPDEQKLRDKIESLRKIQEKEYFALDWAKKIQNSDNTDTTGLTEKQSEEWGNMDIEEAERKIKKRQEKIDELESEYDSILDKEIVSKDVKSYKANTLKKVEPKKEIKEKQDKINKTVTDKVEEAIKELGIEDKIYDVAMQGSYEKGTDLPDSGSDMDLFVVFNTEVSQEELDKFGLEIGRKVLNKDFIEKQGWIFDYSEEITATSKYVQAFFKDGKQDVEVQIVPTRHLTLEQIKEKKLNGEDIDIGMERTPHQTEYMKEALKGKEGEVRVLKKFMKEAGLYGSNLKEMGFSGYSAEVLIDQFGSFENVIDFFADLKEGDIVDKQGGGKRNKENAFSMIDPIDPNRDLVSAFSTQKIGKTINVAKYFKETGKIPKTKYREMDSATITFDSDESNEDKLIGQVRRLAKSYQEQLGKMGFEVNTKEETINGIKVEVPDFSFESEWDDDKKKTTVKINFGTNTKTIPKEYKDKGVDLDREKAVDGYKKANSGLKFVEEDGKLKAIKERQFTDIADAIKYLMNTEGKIVKSNQNEFIKNNGRTSTGKSKFEEI